MAADRWVGQILGGRYQIEELIGQGGMSAVYKARDPNLQRTVAIKLIHPHLSANEEFVRRFESEATAIARLRHPNIVQVFDFNHDGDVYYMVLEFVAGETLQRRIKRMNAAGRHLPVRDTLRYMIDICKAADYAHQRGMIHRDIKPANVMLDVNGSAILMDFGIARIIGGHQHTATGAVLGTAMYMSPEQIQGLHPDARSDIYSIGVTLFEALGGRPPFEADSAMTLMMMHLNDPVPDLSQLNPAIPEAVRAIVNRALEKDRVNRFQTGEEMATAMEGILGSIPREASVPLPPVTTPSEIKPPPAPVVTLPEVIPTPTPAVTPPEVKPVPPSNTLVEAPAPAFEATFVEPPPPESTVVETAAPPAGRVKPAAETAAPVSIPAVKQPVPRRKTLLWAAAAVLVLALAGGGYLLFRQINPSDASPAKNPPATATVGAVVPPAKPAPTSTPEPLPTATQAPPPTEIPAVIPTVPTPPVIGGADQIAFVLRSDIWIANVDGSAAHQITTDGTAKKYLRWLPDGEGLSFISGKCIQITNLNGGVATVTCFNNSSYLDSFEVSPDGKQVALSVDRQLYLLPFDLDRLAQADTHSKLTAMANCAEFAPYQRNAATSARWSKDGSLLAAVTLGVLKSGKRGDVVQVFAVDQCIANPMVQVQFPEPHFTFGEYARTPTFSGFTWDGEMLFVMSGITRNDGFGDLHFFNRETYKATTPVDPVNGVCCYRDPTFSPDGKYLLFAFQVITVGSDSQTQIFYIPFGTIGTGAKYTPLPLPGYTDPR
ncbi:MAG: protein kinase, partial [Anaerolineaceae bacterium]